MSRPVDVLPATAEYSSEVPGGMLEVSEEQFWAAVRATELNVHPTPNRFDTDWTVVGSRHVWGWVSQGFAGPFDYEGKQPKRYALTRGAA